MFDGDSNNSYVKYWKDYALNYQIQSHMCNVFFG